MKKLYLIFGVALMLISSNLSAQYCTPPSFLSGPFTGIINVNFAGINNTTLGTNGYEDNTGGTSAAVTQGGSYPISIGVEHTILNSGFSDNVDLRVWIDWNADGDFDDAGEEVVSQLVDVSGAGSSNTAVYNGNITVPAGATVGTTRMRVYEDMLVSDGHVAPTPCGYSSGIGQHGESEDYTVVVSASGGGGAEVENNSMISEFSIYPNPSVDYFNLSFNLQNSENTSISVFNMLGELVYEYNGTFNAGPNSFILETGKFEKGIYFISLSTSDSKITKEVTIL